MEDSNGISQQIQFFEKVMNNLSNFANESIIIHSDFTCFLTELDNTYIYMTKDLEGT